MHHRCHVMHTIYAHADSFAVVVRFASVVCFSICFFPDRIMKWWCEIWQVPGCSSAVFHRRALYSLPILHFCSRSYSSLVSWFFRVTCPIPLVHLSFYIYALVPFHYLSPVVWCLASPASRSACLGSVVISIWYRDMLGGWYMSHLWIMLVKLIMIIAATKLRWDNNLMQRHRWETPLSTTSVP